MDRPTEPSLWPHVNPRSTSLFHIKMCGTLSSHKFGFILLEVEHVFNIHKCCWTNPNLLLSGFNGNSYDCVQCCRAYSVICCASFFSPLYRWNNFISLQRLLKSRPTNAIYYILHIRQARKPHDLFYCVEVFGRISGESAGVHMFLRLCVGGMQQLLCILCMFLTHLVSMLLIQSTSVNSN